MEKKARNVSPMAELKEFAELDIEILEDIIAPGLVTLDMGNDASEVVVGRTWEHEQDQIDNIYAFSNKPGLTSIDGVNGASGGLFNFDFSADAAGQGYFDSSMGDLQFQDGALKVMLNQPMEAFGFEVSGLDSMSSMTVSLFGEDGQLLNDMDPGNNNFGGEFPINQSTFPGLAQGTDGSYSGFIGFGVDQGLIASVEISVVGEDVVVNNFVSGNSIASPEVPALGGVGIALLSGALGAGGMIMMKRSKDKKAS